VRIPKGHRALNGSEHGLPLGGKALGPADPKEPISVRVIVRRRTDVDAEADLQAQLNLHPALRERISEAEHARRFGAAQADLDAITAFLRTGGLQIAEVHAASRTIIASGTCSVSRRPTFLAARGRGAIRRRGPSADSLARSMFRPKSQT
jgi:Pro-kumamolisin, activation domain